MNDRMNQLHFCIVHHATTPFHTEVLNLSILSIRNFYPDNPIIVCKTSSSMIPDAMRNYDRVSYYDTPRDGSHIYGAIRLLVDLNLDPETNYIIMHDSMFISRPLPESLLWKQFYYLWYFSGGGGRDHHDIIHKLIPKTNVENTDSLFHMYEFEFSKSWVGLFGPGFGGKIGCLNYLWSSLPSDILDYTGRFNVMAAERYLAVLSHFLGIVEKFEPDFSLNGNFNRIPHMGRNCNTVDEVQTTINLPYAGSYMRKVWIGRP
jgi:hypothetical protein